MKVFKRVLKIAVDIILWVFLIFAVLMTIFSLSAQSSDGIPSLGGKTVLCVESDSMSPTFVSGDLLIGNKLTDEEKQNCQKGDIITFYADLDNNGENEINTHRIVDINYNEDGSVESYVTQGDNKETNLTADSYFTVWEKVLSKWDEDELKLSGVGTFVSYMQTPKNFLVVIVVPLILFFFYEIFRFIKTLLAVKGEKVKELSKEEEDAIKERAIQEYLASHGGGDPKASDDKSVTETDETEADSTESEDESAPETDETEADSAASEVAEDTAQPADGNNADEG